MKKNEHASEMDFSILFHLFFCFFKNYSLPLQKQQLY